MSKSYDVFIIGGGINGCGIARDAAGRGYSVCLVEMNDIASGTSSQSSKLIHGGLRYLENYKFRLVKEALNEREVLLRSAPHIIWPMRFILPHNKNMRSKWILRLGLFIYDNIGKRKILPKTRYLNLKKESVGVPLKSTFSKGFEYSDCWVDDARLTMLNAVDAKQKGAEINTHTKCIKAIRKENTWHITTKDKESNKTNEYEAKVIVNASGPWVDEVLGEAIGEENANNVRLIKGSHIIVPKIYDHDRAYIFQNNDGRIIFALPYEQDFLIIGTSDQEYKSDLEKVEISEQEIKYFCEAASQYFEKPVRQEDVVGTYSGVRPLFDDGADDASDITRDYIIQLENGEKNGGLINIFGGKITTYRKLAEAVLEKIEISIGVKGKKWTKDSHLPGGEFKIDGFDELVGKICEKHPFLESKFIRRLARAYGTRAWDILKDVNKKADMGEEFGGSLTEREVKYLVENEWAINVEDIVWRRTKLGIRMNDKQIEKLDNWMNKPKITNLQVAQ